MSINSLSGLNGNSCINYQPQCRENESSHKSEAPLYSCEDKAVISKEGDETPELPKNFKMARASSYADGSDVKELAYSIAQGRDRGAASLGKYMVLKANDADNDIRITKGENGGITVNVDGVEKKFNAGQAKTLIIDGGAGNDKIIADEDLGVQLHVVGGEGDDTIKTGDCADFIIDNYGSNYIMSGDGNDRIIANQLDFGDASTVQTINAEKNGKTETVSFKGNYIDCGNGRNYVEAGFGDDYIIGRAGNDTIYGLGGNDYIDAGDGRNYIDGGAGNDSIIAGSGNNMIFGGNGDDTILAGNGNNVITGGRGTDSITAGDGRNRVTSSGSDTVSSSGTNTSVETVIPMDIPANISISGDDAGYKERITSDLENLASNSTGQKMLEGLGSTGHNVVIASTDGGNYCSYQLEGILNDDCTPNEGSDAKVAYNRFRNRIGTADWGERPPIVGMYHEMAHAYDAGNGILDKRMYNYDGSLASKTMDDPGEVKGAELQAVGIDTGSKDIQLNPEGISENALREFLGIDIRPEY